jgi:TonB family protein
MKRTRVRLYFLISIAIHLSLVLAWGISEWTSPPDGTDRWEEQDDNRLVFQLIEVPSNIPEERPETESNLVSDKDTRAADMYRRDTDIEEPYAAGDFDFKEYEHLSAEKAQPDQQRSSEEEKEGESLEYAMLKRNVDYLQEMRTSRYENDPRESIAYKSLLSGAERQGGISFNTYNWDFAPYMLAMKREVERHLYPPYAFTHMGAVSGTNIIRFIVMPDGHIEALEILESDAHFSLDRTSLSAIELSAPFLPLPHNFPEAYLEVTAHFSYIVRR